jgi:methionine synthase II (cobalamin-independent)
MLCLRLAPSARGDISAQELEQREDAAISDAVKMQVDVGFRWPPTENSA